MFVISDFVFCVVGDLLFWGLIVCGFFIGLFLKFFEVEI